MIITIDLEVLDKEDLTPDDYVFLWGLYHNVSTDNIPLYPNHIPLQEKGFIKLGEDWVLRTKGKELFMPKGLDAKFIEFYSSYPLFVPNGHGGKRYLRDSSSDTKQALICKKKYLDIIKKSPTLHTQILKATEIYVKNESPFIKGVEVYINQQAWNKYIGVEEKGNNEGEDI